MFPVRVPWTRKPPLGTRPDESNFFAQKRMWLLPITGIINGDMLDAYYRHYPTYALAGPLRQKFLQKNSGTDAKFNGKFLRLNASSFGTMFDAGNGQDALAETPLHTWAIKVRCRDFFNQGSSLNTIMSYGSLSDLNVWMDSSERLNVYHNSSPTLYSSLTFTDQKFHTIIITVGPSVLTIYFDGVAHATTITRVQQAATSGLGLSIGGNFGLGTRFTNCDIEWFGIFRGAFNAGQVKSLNDNFYQTMQPQTQLFPAVVAGEVSGRIMSSQTRYGGLAGAGGIAGQGGGLAG